MKWVSSTLLLELFKKRFTALGEAFFQPFGAIAIRTGPGLGAVKVAAVLATVSVFHVEEVEIFFPVGAFLLQRCGAKARFNPVRGSVFVHASMFEVVDVFIAGDGAAA